MSVVAKGQQKSYQEFTVGRYRVAINSAYAVATSDLERLVTTCAQPAGRAAEASNVGRRVISKLELSGVGSVVVKHYLRGGFLRHILRRNYFRLGSSRAEREYCALEQVRALGVSAPEPIGFVTKGGFFYNNWLLTREIPSAISLAEWAVQNGENLRALSETLIEQVGALIDARLFHIDLHPGNVLLDGTSRLWLLDFDKSTVFHGRKNKLRDKYLVRWRRAVLKHGLPEVLSEYVALGLRRNFERQE